MIIRPARITDERALQELMYCLSDDSCYRRFMTYKKVHPHEEMHVIRHHTVRKYCEALVSCRALNLILRLRCCSFVFEDRPPIKRAKRQQIEKTTYV